MESSKETAESRARRGKVAHLRSAPPFEHATVCGVEISGRARVVSREAFDDAATQGTACKNCVRAASRETPA